MYLASFGSLWETKRKKESSRDGIKDQGPRLGGRGQVARATDEQDGPHGYRLILQLALSLQACNILVSFVCVLSIALSVTYVPAADCTLRFESVRCLIPLS